MERAAEFRVLADDCADIVAEAMPIGGEELRMARPLLNG